jgi:1,2-diacylglycerol 3-alpha-glucosyltransferase
MKVLHCCLAAFYIDDYAYQENILPKFHRMQGHHVEIIASTETYIEKGRLGYVKPSVYKNKDGIKVTRLPYSRWLPHRLVRKLRIYVGLYEAIEQFQPDIIFLHDVQFLSVYDIKRYIRRNHGVTVFADGHTDFINSARNWISKNILHKIIYRHCVKVLLPFTNMFWGVTPLRVKFFEEVYNVPKEKLGLLVLGADDSLFDQKNYFSIRNDIRTQYNISTDDFVIITGGKIDERKNIHSLMEVVGTSFPSKVKLLVFGEPTEKMQGLISRYFDCSNIINLGWLSPERLYDFLYAADLGFFPGTHSVLWEQCVGVGLPCIFRRWSGMEHIDIDGNCLFLETGSVEEIKELLDKLILDKKIYENLRNKALLHGPRLFAYSEIAKRAIRYS